jgi:hypothetical protein
VTFIDLTWASAKVSAEGYQPTAQLWLHDTKHEDKGILPDLALQVVSFNISLRRIEPK